jgi:hypothetical protein
MKTAIVLITLALAATFAHGGSLQQHMRQGVVVQQSVAVKLENKVSAQAFRGPAKQIRNLNYDALGHHENMILHQSVDVQSKRTPPQSPDPAIPLFMRLADASIDYKEWKSSMFCTQVDFSFPPAAPAVKIQLQLNIGIMGQTAYDANTQPTHPGLIKAEFMLGFGGTITGQFGKLEMSASLYAQGNMVLESRVPAEYLKGKDQAKVYPLLGTVWAVKQWAMNKVKNSALYKWIKNRKKDIANKEITKLLTGIRSDLQGANDAAAKTACEAFCKIKANECSPSNAENAVSADCVYGSVGWAAGAFVDFCGEMDVNTKRCKNGSYKNDDRIDSDAIMDSAAIKFSEFINELRANGNTLFENKGAAYTAHDIKKANIYRETIEKAWRKVYLGVEEAPATKLFGITLYKHRMKCRNIPDAYDPTTKKIKDPLKAIMPLICAWMKYGGSLDVPKTGYIFTDGKDNENLKRGLIFMYKELFPTPDKAADPAFEKWIARLQTGKDPDMLMNGAQLQNRSSFLGGWDSDTEHGININSFNCHAVHTILSLPPKEVMGSLQAMMDDLTDAGNEFEQNKMAQKGCTPTEDGCCGLQKISLTGTIGVTVGDSGVGFCTPDTNPLQVTRAKKLEWEVDETATKAGGVGAITERKGYCFLGNGKWQPREITVTGVIPLDNLVPSDANHYMYINLFSKGNWALNWNPKQVGIQLSYMTKALQAPLTIALTPACVVLQAIKQTLQTAIRNLGNILTGEPTIALALDVVSKTKAQLPNAVKAYCDKPENACATTSETVGKEVLKYVALIGAGVGGVNVNTIINTAGEWAEGVSSALSGGQVKVGFGRDTYSQIDLKVRFNRKGTGALTLPKSWEISTVDGDTGISFSMNNIASLSLELGGVLTGAGVDIKVAGYMGTGSSVDCSAQS